MLGCRRDAHSAKVPCAGFLHSVFHSSALDQNLKHLLTQKAVQLTLSLLVIYLRLCGGAERPACITSDLFGHSFCVVSGAHLAL